MKRLLALLLAFICLFSFPASLTEESCPHTDIMCMDKYEQVSFYDPEMHWVGYYSDVYCKDCGLYLYSECISSDLENHSFDSNGRCTRCGYVQNCSHPNRECYYSYQFPSYYSDKEHIIPLYYMYYCPDCGDCWWEIQSGKTYYEAHTFNEDGYCTVCWYNKEYDILAPNPNILPDDPVAKRGMVQIGDAVITPVRMDVRKFDSPDSRHYSYAGPGTEYESTGGYLPQKIRDAYGWFIEGDYVLTDISYATLKRSMVYLKKSAFTSTVGIPVIDISGNAKPGKVTAETVPSMFPQKNRRMFSEQTVKLAAGAEITVYFEKDGWYYCEFVCSDKMPARGWLHKDSVQIQ